VLQSAAAILRGALVSLQNSQYALLLAFLQQPQHPLSREQLLRATRSREDVFDRSIDIRVLRLRRRLEINRVHHGSSRPNAV
jgi:two-component system, OmpR family, response regulator